MSELKVLSAEEVDALLKITQESNNDLTQLANGENADSHWNEIAINKKSLANIAELTCVEAEKNLATFLRKKIALKLKNTNCGKFSDCLADKLEKHVFTIFRIMPHESYGITVMDLPLLYHSISLLYGGTVNDKEPVFESPGKMGMSFAERVSKVALESLSKACDEFGKITCEMIKTISRTTLTSKINFDERAYTIEMTVMFGEIETSFDILVNENFLRAFIPENAKDVTYVESNFWRSAIETQVVDSLVSLTVTLPDVSVKMNDLMGFKNGDLIPIGDPTLVYVCLNNLKLFRANAGQANSKRVAKILSEI